MISSYISVNQNVYQFLHELFVINYEPAADSRVL